MQLGNQELSEIQTNNLNKFKNVAGKAEFGYKQPLKLHWKEKLDKGALWMYHPYKSIDYLIIII